MCSTAQVSSEDRIESSLSQPETLTQVITHLNSTGEGCSKTPKRHGRRVQQSEKTTMNCFYRERLVTEACGMSKLLGRQIARQNPEISSDQSLAYIGAEPKLKEEWRWPTGVVVNDAYAKFMQSNV